MKLLVGELQAWGQAWEAIVEKQRPTEPMETYRRVERIVWPWVRRVQLDRAISRCEKELRLLPATEYHRALGRSWLSQTGQASRWLAAFYRKAAKALTVKALYLEMNRFEINPDEWYVDGFAYDTTGDPHDSSWLCGWEMATDVQHSLVLAGMDDLQSLFARDYRDTPSADVLASSELVILLLNLRMQELIHAAARAAQGKGKLPKDLPVLAAAHDSDMVCVVAGVLRKGPAPPPPPLPPVEPLAPGVYRLDGGCLPWDVLDYVDEEEGEAVGKQLDRMKTLAGEWDPPVVRLRRRHWRCDIVSLYPHWAATAKARKALTRLLDNAVEFLPLKGAAGRYCVVHPLRHVELAEDAIVASGDASVPYRLARDNMTVIESYSFKPSDLQGLHWFCVKQAHGSPSRKAGHPFGSDYVSGELKHAVEVAGLRGVTFEEAFIYG